MLLKRKDKNQKLFFDFRTQKWNGNVVWSTNRKQRCFICSRWSCRCQKRMKVFERKTFSVFFKELKIILQLKRPINQLWEKIFLYSFHTRECSCKKFGWGSIVIFMISLCSSAKYRNCFFNCVTACSACTSGQKGMFLSYHLNQAEHLST